jgi:hypothetical protein
LGAIEKFYALPSYAAYECAVAKSQIIYVVVLDWGIILL